MLAWLDLETTGLEPGLGSILEIALVITTGDLVPLASFTSLVKPVTDLTEMDDYVRQMHLGNGLLDRVHQAPRRYEVQLDAVQFMERNSWGKYPLAGSTVSFDRAWLNVHMPELEKKFSYRHVDVSSFKEMAHRWNPPAYRSRPQGKPAHRALADIMQSIEELKHYRKTFVLEDYSVEAA